MPECVIFFWISKDNVAYKRMDKPDWAKSLTLYKANVGGFNAVVMFACEGECVQGIGGINLSKKELSDLIKNAGKRFKRFVV